MFLFCTGSGNGVKHEKGRLKCVKKLISHTIFSLSVGCGKTKLASINLDINPSVHPEIIADTRNLPKSEIFDSVFFLDVIEHLKRGTETRALEEIYGVLRKNGELILSAPNNNHLFTMLDPTFWLFNHRHYRKTEIKTILEKIGYKITLSFISGNIWAALNWLWHCLIYPFLKIFPNREFHPLILQSLENKEYNFRYQNGYTIFLRAKA